MGTITLTTPLSIVTQPEIKKTLTEIKIERIVDRNQEKKVIAFLVDYPRELVLWADDEYVAIGDWTQAQAESKIVELLTD